MDNYRNIGITVKSPAVKTRYGLILNNYAAAGIYTFGHNDVRALYRTVKARDFLLALYAAQAGSPKIETEHLLLGLLSADMALARRFLGSPWSAEEVWREVESKHPVRAAIPAGVDLPLSPEGKRVLLLAAEEADRLSSRKIRTEHLLLGLLRDEGGFAAALLNGYHLSLASTRDELSRSPHDDSIIEQFVKEPSALPEGVAESRDRLRSIASRMGRAIANQDFATAKSCSDEERIERDKLRTLYEEHGLSGWIF